MPIASGASGWEAELALSPDLCHLNHAAVGPWPRRSAVAVQRFAEENVAQGSLAYPRWLETEQRLRERLARLIGLPDAADIALVKNTSEALSIIAAGLEWQAGDRVVGIAQEFPSNRIVWQALADRGVTWHGLDLDAARDPEAELMALCDDRTRVLAVSWVQYARGLRLDLQRLGVWCRARGIHLCVDGIQAIGALPCDLTTIDADVLVADGHKWMLGPEGVALLYVRPALRERLRLHQFGWHMVEHSSDFERTDWIPAHSARRFECGSPNLLGIHALEASLSLLEEVGMAAVATAIEQRVQYLLAALDARGCEILSPRQSERRAGILTFRVPGISTDQLYHQLMARRVLCANRGGGIRFSPHFYTPQSTLDRALDQLDACIGR